MCVGGLDEDPHNSQEAPSAVLYLLLFPCRYMFIGGTNFGYWNGKNNFISICANDATVFLMLDLRECT